MGKYYSLRIPQPCHIDWNLMTPSDKGRFCSSCDKTVIDFSQKTPLEIREYMSSQNGERVCGRLFISTPEKIVIKIPLNTLKKQTTFYRSFTCALLIVMGTTLLSCNNSNGSKQNIDAVEVIDNEVIDEKEIVPVIGMIVSTPVVPVGQVVLDDCIYYNDIPFAIVNEVPEFSKTPQYLSQVEKKEYFSNRVTDHMNNHFNRRVFNSIVLGRYKSFAQFKIDTTGQIVDIKIKAKHKILKEETRRVLDLLPKFIPGKDYDGNKIATNYTLPIIFNNK